MFANKLLFPFVLAAIFFLYLQWEYPEGGWSFWIIPPTLVAALIYIFAPQINWWWYQTHPLKTDPLVKMILGKHLPFYDKLSVEEKAKFDQRVELFQMATEFIPQGLESVPKDVKGIIASNAVWMTFGLDDYLFPKFETMVIYPHPFPSPQYKDKLVSSETEENDGVIIFSLQHFMPSFLEYEKYYPSGMHEFARVFIASHPNEDYPEIGEEFWQKLPLINNLTKEKVEHWLNAGQGKIKEENVLVEADPLQVAIVHFFFFPEKFKEIFPNIFDSLQRVFKTNF